MKRLYFLLLMFISMNAFASCDKEEVTDPNPGQSEQEQPDTPDKPDSPDSPLSKTLVAYFSATGTTRAVAERIAELTGADIYSIEPSEPYAADPYDDSDRIQREAYSDLRPGVANLPESLEQYDTIFVGSPLWWHQPAMVVCTFLEHYDLTDKTVIPFITYGARTYLNEGMQKLYKVTPNSVHIPATLPEDLDPENIREPQNDDAGIDVPQRANDVEPWLKRIGMLE